MYESKCWYEKVPIQIEGRKLYANLMAIEMSDFDVIFGMDWLSTHHAIINCHKKRVKFQPLQADEFEFRRTSTKKFVPIILALQAHKMLKNDYRGYLVNIVDEDKMNELSSKDVPVVREFLSVFPEDLLGLSQDREVKFIIKLIHGTNPISKAPYLLAPAELKELKT